MTASQPLPRHTQISETLIREIASGLRPDGSRLPPERQMASEYGVAVGTLRKALASLETKGVLERVQGSGNYVRRRTDVSSIYAPFRLERPEGGGLPTADILAVTQTNAPAAAREFGFPIKATQIDRVRSLDDIPVAIERIWLSGVHMFDDSRMKISDSLYLFYRDAFGLVISRVEDSIGVDRLPDWADLPGRISGDAVGFIERRAWDQSGEAAEYSRTWFDPGKARFISRTDVVAQP